MLSDERLTRRAVGGDERAFAMIFRRYHQSLYRFCLAIVGNPEDAQDALQNTMIKVMRALPGEERRIDLKPWLYRIAHNEAIDLLRRHRETLELGIEQVAPGYGLAEDVATRERLRRLLVDLQELPERQREVLVMRELSGLDFDEIGAALETSGAVVRQTLYEARKSLHQMEEGREMGCDAVSKALSDGDGRVTRRRDVRAHLRSCASCRAFRDQADRRQRDLAALSPLPGVAAAGILHGLLGGGSQAASGGGLAAALGGGAAKTIGASALAKGVATVAVVAAVGVTAADRRGVIHLGPPGEDGASAGKAEPAVPSGQREKVGSPAVSEGQPGTGAKQADGKPGRTSLDAGGAKSTEKGQAQESPAAGQTPKGAEAQIPASEHPSGLGHEKQQPEAAAGGQETAAVDDPQGAEDGGGQKESAPTSENGAPNGNGATKKEGAKKPHPSKPSHPANSNASGNPQKGPPENPPRGAAPEGPPQAQEPQTPAEGAPPPGLIDNPGKGAEKGNGNGAEKGKGHD
jgi:RNA polymerase sigma factor (sigma-70 family)